ncbi:MAG: twin-arginine translocase TatA/TatE family subunit [Candidatus Kryptonium sp.]
MFDNIGFGELLVIALFILIFFGPKKIPDIARTLGKAVREFRKAMQDVQSELQSVTGIDLNSEFTSSTPQLEEKPTSNLDDLKFIKADEPSTEPANVGATNELKLGRNNKPKASKKKEVKRVSQGKRNVARMKTKSKKR